MSRIASASFSATAFAATIRSRTVTQTDLSQTNGNTQTLADGNGNRRSAGLQTAALAELEIIAESSRLSFEASREEVRGPRSRLPGSPRGADSGDGGLEDDESVLDGLDPKTRAQFQALLDLLALTNPENAEEAAEQLQKTLRVIHGGQRSSQDGSGNIGGGEVIESRRLEIAIETTVTEIQAEFENGGSVSAEFVQVRFTANLQRVRRQSDPLVLDLNGNGRFDVSSAEDGHDFDIRGEGKEYRTATVIDGDALLAIDRNNNGQIDNGTELFGDQNGAVDGFAELAKYDENQDGQIDQKDSIFSKLLAFADDDLDGHTDDNETRSIASLGIERILLATNPIREVVNGNHAIKAGSFVNADGTEGRVGELLFTYLS